MIPYIVENKTCSKPPTRWCSMICMSKPWTNEIHQMSCPVGSGTTCGCVPGLLRQPSDISLWHPIDLGVGAVAVQMVHPMGIKWGYYGDTRPGKHTKSYWKWPIYSGFSHEKWWFSIAILNYQRVLVRIVTDDSWTLRVIPIIGDITWLHKIIH